MLEAMSDSLVTLFSFNNLMFLILGVMIGLIVGAIPGLSGVTGLTMLLPFVYGFSDVNAALLMLLGLAAVVTTGDSIPAVLFGVPGTVGAQATIIDGFAMAKKGEAGRALGAAYCSSMIGGVIGAIAILGVLPIAQPLVLSMGAPELFMIALLGVSMVSAVSGGAPLMGVAVGLFGVLISMIGQDPLTATYRWTFGQPYLLEGIPIVAALLGIFAIPDMCELIAREGSIAPTGGDGRLVGVMQGVKDTFRHWWLVVRCSIIGTYVGMIPALGSDVVSWIAYGHARQTEKDTSGFGSGDIRGVIGPESANNAKVGGALIPTIIFGVPGSLMMLFMLGALNILGVTPGPDMVTKHLDLTLTLVWGLALANILAAGLLLFVSKYVAKLCFVPIKILAPIVTVLIFFAASQATNNLLDYYVLTLFGGIGWMMKRLGWPRPPLVIGMVLGPIIQRYLMISLNAYGFSWLARPGVIIIAAILVGSLFYSVRTNVSEQTANSGVIGG